MSVTQTVEIPASRRLVIDVPREVPGECPICAAHRDPVTGEERFNAETLAAFEEGDAMLRGEIPAQRFNSIEELLADLRS